VLFRSRIAAPYLAVCFNFINLTPTQLEIDFYVGFLLLFRQIDNKPVRTDCV